MMTQLTSFDQYLQTSDIEILSLKQRLRLNDFQNKQRLIQMQCQIEVYKTRAQEYKYRYQTLLQNNGDEEISKLLQKLKEKENQILEMRAKEIENKSRLVTRYKEIQIKSNQKLQGQLNELVIENKYLNQKIEEIKSRAIQALVEKQNIINNLTKKKDKDKDKENVEESIQFLELKDDYEKQIEKYQNQIKDYELQLNESKAQNKELMDRLEKNSAQYDEKLIKLECDLEQKMHSNITQVFNTYQANENNLLNDLQQQQASLQKLESRNNQLEIQNQKLKHQIQIDKEKLVGEIDNLVHHHAEEISKMEKNYELMIRNKTKEIEDLVKSNQKLKGDFRRIVEEQVEGLREYGQDGSENNRKKNKLGSIRKLSQHSMSKQVHKDIFESFNARINQNDNNSDKQRIRLNELKDFEENYEWLGEHESIRVTDFDEDVRQINNELKQSIQSIEVLQSYPLTNNNNLRDKSLSQSQASKTIKQQLRNKDNLKQSKAKERELIDDQINKLKINLEQSQSTISDLNKTIGALTKQLQENRQMIQQLKKHKQKSVTQNSKEIELRNEIDSTKQYLCQLQKQLLSQKWKYTELMDYLRSEIEVREIEYQKQMAKATQKRNTKS